MEKFFDGILHRSQKKRFLRALACPVLLEWKSFLCCVVLHSRIRVFKLFSIMYVHSYFLRLTHQIFQETNPSTGAEEDRCPDEDDKTAALAFKIATDPYVGRLTFFRVYSGKIESGSYIYNSRSGNKERISRLYQMHSNKTKPC